MTDFGDEAVARRILTTAIDTGRAGELLSRLFDGDTVTVDARTGDLVFVAVGDLLGGLDNG